MAPKGVRARSKLYSLAVSLSPGTTITDTRKQCFIIEKQFAQGGFGRIYSGHMRESVEYGKTGSLAIKVEPKGNGPLFTEITVFQRILKHDMIKEYEKKHGIEHLGLPPHLGSGIFVYEGEELRFLAMPKYGCSFENYRIECGGKVTVDVALAVARQCADCLAYMQDQDYVHADLKGENILLADAKDFLKCYLVDFGLSRMIKSNVDKPDKKRAHNGTLMFTSIDAHRGCSPSPRGDLEILIYNILFWITGYLPWQKLGNNSENVFAKKLEFAKEVEKNVKALIQDDIATCIIKLFKIVQETAYTSKVDYAIVKEYMNNMVKDAASYKRKSQRVNKSNKTCIKHIKGNKTISVIGEASEPSSSCEDYANITGLRKRGRNSKKALLDADDNDGKNCNKFNVKDSLKAVAVSPCSSSLMQPERITKRNSDEFEPDIKRSSLDESLSGSPSSQKHCEGTHERKHSGKSFDVETAGECTTLRTKKMQKNVTKRTCGGRECGSTKTDASGSGSLLNSSGLTAGESEISTVIPGVRNMKKIRRSLNAKLVEKYKCGNIGR